MKDIEKIHIDVQDLMKNYGVMYMRSVRIFKNTNEWLIWAFLTNRYIYQVKQKLKEPEVLHNMVKSLSTQTNVSRPTIYKILKNLEDRCLISKVDDDFSSGIVYNSPKNLGIIATFNSADNDVIKKLTEAYNCKNVKESNEAIVRLGVQELNIKPTFNQPLSIIDDSDFEVSQNSTDKKKYRKTFIAFLGTLAIMFLTLLIKDVFKSLGFDPYEQQTTKLLFFVMMIVCFFVIRLLPRDM